MVAACGYNRVSGLFRFRLAVRGNSQQKVPIAFFLSQRFTELRIAVGSDHRGVEMRGKLIELLVSLGQEVVDVGTGEREDVDYPDVAADVARKVAGHEVDRGILICGSGLGMCIAANKIAGVRAAPCYDDVTAELSRRHNDLNVLCLSGDMLGDRLADRIVDIWLKTPFEGGRHARRLQKIAELEHNGKHVGQS